MGDDPFVNLFCVGFCSAFSASDRTFQTMLSTVTAFWIAVPLHLQYIVFRSWILHIMDQWLYSISDHCFDDLTNYRQNCYSSIVDGIVFASDVKRCTLSYFANGQEARPIVLRSVWESGKEVSLVLISINYISTHY
jgi:hypothetical protein